MPYSRVTSAPYAEELLDDLLNRCKSNLNKIKSDVNKGLYKGLGKKSNDEQQFQAIIDKEGVIDLRGVSYDEL